MDSRQLIVWCAEAAKSLKRMFQSRNTSILTSEKLLSELVSIWISVAETSLQSTLRFWALNSINAETILSSACTNSGVSSSSPEDSVAFALETIKMVGIMIMEASEMICCTTEADDLISRCIDVLSTVGLESIAVKGLKLIISSPYCAKGYRGHWCARFVRFSVSVLTDEEKVFENINNNDDDDDDDDDKEVKSVLAVTTSAGCDRHQCEEIYEFIEGIFNSHPELLVGSEIHFYYDIVLSIELTAAKKNINRNTTKNYEFVSTVAKRAIENCPHVNSFWDKCENILRLQGCHKDANHIRWRRERECNQ